MNKKVIVYLNRITKRCFDIVVAFLLLIILSPLIVSLFCLIRFDGGRAIYGHQRIGLKGKKFNCYKFRSMINDAEKILQNLLATDQNAREEWARDFKLKNDPRITRIGHFIRKTSFDELPQLWNVLKGDMSLVGPRPIIESELPRYGAYAKYYLSVRPGMTGLWQISGRNDISYRERVRLDVRYVISWSLLNDIIILLKTTTVIFRRNGAY